MRAICQGRLYPLEIAAGTDWSVVDSKASDGAVAKTKLSASTGNQNPTLLSSNFNLFTHPHVF